MSDRRDPDDAPELGDDWFADAHQYEGDRLVKRGKGPLPEPSEGEPKREKIIKVRVSAEEHELLKWRCPKARLAEWMREQCLNPDGDWVRQTKGPEPVDPALLRQLAGIGNNLNQIARRVNSGEWGAVDRVAILAALSAVERELAEVRGQYR
ncbi:MobC family plasmid mobilization relaxosome protein [Kushneria aurantia]|uniref:MobC family plasmid mobilization relaxosome protein n=1 Tax=Kushneria aurantia TaxID=504092 RepID=A0ABV6G845_9GAMM